MDKTLILTIFILCSSWYFCTASTEIKTCAKNEEWSNCTNECLADKCSDFYYNGEPPKFCPLSCWEGCECKDGYVVDDLSNSGCVLPENCPNPCCAGNREYIECGSACPLTCQFPEQRPCQKNCVAGCFCRTSLYEDGNGNCIPLDKCPLSSQLHCGKNEIADACPYEPQPTCREPFPNAIKPYECIKQCICAPPYVRSLKSGDCVDRDTCEAECNSKYKAYNSCGTFCPTTCTNRLDDPLPCIDVCVEGCDCKPGYILDKQGNCIPPEFCDCK